MVNINELLNKKVKSIKEKQEIKSKLIIEKQIKTSLERQRAESISKYSKKIQNLQEEISLKINSIETMHKKFLEHQEYLSREAKKMKEKTPKEDCGKNAFLSKYINFNIQYYLEENFKLKTMKSIMLIFINKVKSQSIKIKKAAQLKLTEDLIKLINNSDSDKQDVKNVYYSSSSGSEKLKPKKSKWSFYRKASGNEKSIKSLKSVKTIKRVKSLTNSNPQKIENNNKYTSII